MRELSAADFLYMTCRHICKMTDLLLPSLFVVVPLNGTIANPKASGAHAWSSSSAFKLQEALILEEERKKRKCYIIYIIYIIYIYIYIFNIYIYIIYI